MDKLRQSEEKAACLVLKSLRTDALKREDSSTATNSDSSPANSACNSPSRLVHVRDRTIRPRTIRPNWSPEDNVFWNTLILVSIVWLGFFQFYFFIFLGELSLGELSYNLLVISNIQLTYLWKKPLVKKEIENLRFFSLSFNSFNCDIFIFTSERSARSSFPNVYGTNFPQFDPARPSGFCESYISATRSHTF